MYIGIDKEITIPADYKDLIKDPSALIVLCLSIHYRLPYLDCLIGMDYNSLLPKLNVESESESQRIKEKKPTTWKAPAVLKWCGLAESNVTLGKLHQLLFSVSLYCSSINFFLKNVSHFVDGVFIVYLINSSLRNGFQAISSFDADKLESTLKPLN